MSLHCIVWYCMVLYYILWYCMVLHCWLRCAGCISQDTYLLYYYFSGKTFKAATKLTPRDAELVAKVKFCQSFIGMGMVVLMMEVIVKVIHFLQFWWVGMVDAVGIFIHVFVTFYRTQVSLVRSLCPDVPPSVSEWVRHLVETKLMWLWLMKIPSQY